MFQFAPAYTTLDMERLLVARLREEQEGRRDSLDRLREEQVREQERIWRQIQAENGRAREGGEDARGDSRPCRHRVSIQPGTRRVVRCVPVSR